MNRKLIIALVLALMPALLVSGCGREQDAVVETTVPAQESAQAASPVGVGSVAPEWELKDLNDQTVKLSDSRGKEGVIMVFFATWCPSCVQKVPELIAFQNEHKDSAIKLVSVALQQPARTIKRFAESQGANYPFLLDSDGAVARAYGVRGIPMIVAIDAEGAIRYMDHVMPRDLNALVKQLEPSSVPATQSGAQ